MNRNLTGKLLVMILSAYIFWKKLCSHILKDPYEEVIVTYFYKMKAKYMKNMRKSFPC